MSKLIAFLIGKPIIMYVFVIVFGVLLSAVGLLTALLKISYYRNEVLQEKLSTCTANVDTLLENANRREDYMKDMHDVIKRHYDTLPKVGNVDDATLDRYLGLRPLQEGSVSSSDARDPSPKKERDSGNTGSSEDRKR